MTAQIGTTSIDGTPISETDKARIEAEEQLHGEQQCRAVRVVAASSLDVDDCRMLLSMLGLEHDTVVAARAKSLAPAKRSRKRRVAA